MLVGYIILYFICQIWEIIEILIWEHLKYYVTFETKKDGKSLLDSLVSNIDAIAKIWKTL